MSKSLLGALALLWAAPASAACHVPNFMFWPERNDNLVVETSVRAGTVCEHKLGEGPGYHFTAIEVVRQPEHGSAGVAARTVTYRPGRAGKDFYGLKICAVKDGGGKGCSTVYFVATTQ